MLLLEEYVADANENEPYGEEEDADPSNRSFVPVVEPFGPSVDTSYFAHTNNSIPTVRKRTITAMTDIGDVRRIPNVRKRTAPITATAI